MDTNGLAPGRSTVGGSAESNVEGIIARVTPHLHDRGRRIVLQGEGLPYLLEAMTRIDANLVIAGDGPERAALEDRTSYAGLIAGLRGRGISEAALEQMAYENARALFGIQV